MSVAFFKTNQEAESVSEYRQPALGGKGQLITRVMLTEGMKWLQLVQQWYNSASFSASQKHDCFKVIYLILSSNMKDPPITSNNTCGACA